MATLIREDGSESQVTPKNPRNKKFSLKELQAFVRGYIEAVPLPNGKTMLVNEDGKSQPGLKRNNRASLLLCAAGGIPGDFVTGDVLILSQEEWN